MPTSQLLFGPVVESLPFQSMPESTLRPGCRDGLYTPGRVVSIPRWGCQHVPVGRPCDGTAHSAHSGEVCEKKKCAGLKLPLGNKSCNVYRGLLDRGDPWSLGRSKRPWLHGPEVPALSPNDHPNPFHSE